MKASTVKQIVELQNENRKLLEDRAAVLLVLAATIDSLRLLADNLEQLENYLRGSNEP